MTKIPMKIERSHFINTLLNTVCLTFCIMGLLLLILPVSSHGQQTSSRPSSPEEIRAYLEMLFSKAGENHQAVPPGVFNEHVAAIKDDLNVSDETIDKISDGNRRLRKTTDWSAR